MIALAVIAAILLQCSCQTVDPLHISCEGGQESCSTCYKVLVAEIFSRDINLFRVQSVFFPANNTPPAFVTVYYEYDSGEEDVWHWSSAYFYILHPLHVFQFTSLFFSDFNLHSNELHLTLSNNCSNASEDYLMLLTQRVSLI